MFPTLREGGRKGGGEGGEGEREVGVGGREREREGGREGEIIEERYTS